MREGFIVFMGAGLGGVLRMVFQQKFGSLDAVFPWGTLLVNLIGGFFAGFLFSKGQTLSLWVWPLVMTGFLGGFTTFSAFSVETLNMFQSGFVAKACVYSLGSVVGALSLALFGFWAGAWIN